MAYTGLQQINEEPSPDHYVDENNQSSLLNNSRVSKRSKGSKNSSGRRQVVPSILKHGRGMGGNGYQGASLFGKKCAPKSMMGFPVSNNLFKSKAKRPPSGHGNPEGKALPSRKSAMTHNTMLSSTSFFTMMKGHHQPFGNNFMLKAFEMQQKRMENETIRESVDVN